MTCELVVEMDMATAAELESRGDKELASMIT